MFAESVRDEPAPSAGPRWRGRDLLLGLALLALGFLLLVTSLVIVAVVVGAEDVSEIPLGNAIATLAFEAYLGLLVLGLAGRRGFSMRDIGFVRPPKWGPLVVAIVGTYVVLGLYSLVLVYLEEIGVDVSGLDEGNPLPVEGRDNVAVLAVLGVAVIVFAPLSEELFFRAFVFGAVAQIWRPVLGMVASGIAFGLFHLNPSVIAPFTLIGLLFAWSYHESGSLWTPILAHATVNTMSFIITIGLGVEPQ